MTENENLFPGREDDGSAAAAPEDTDVCGENEPGETESLREENAQLFARLQRLQADFDNYRKRVRTEMQDWATHSLCDLVRELLPVIDNLERARQATGSTEALLAGVDLVHRQFLSVLEKYGLSMIEACGIQFDPSLHHAILQVEGAEPENTVIEELQRGYRLKDRVLRASLVKVAGGAKSQAEEQEQETGGNSK
jgi:molecular chaperone GrpE